MKSSPQRKFLRLWYAVQYVCIIVHVLTAGCHRRGEGGCSGGLPWSCGRNLVVWLMRIKKLPPPVIASPLAVKFFLAHAPCLVVGLPQLNHCLFCLL